MTKLDWAESHVHKFDKATQEYLAVCPMDDTVTHDFFWDGPKMVFFTERKAKSKAKVPKQLGLIAGDAIHGMRSSVDNLLWITGHKYGASDKISLVFSQTRESHDNTSRRLEYNKLPIPIQDWILGLQIFSDNQDDDRYLYRLHKLWNVDKHRTPTLVTLPAPGLGVRTVAGILHSQVNDGEITITTIGNGPFDYDIVLELQFEEVDCEYDATTLLYSINSHIRNTVVPLFRQYL